MRRRFRGYQPGMAVDDVGCAQHVWVLAVIGEGRGRLEIASTCSVCGALNDEAGTTTPGDAAPSW
jgi:hypothetical protein